MFEIEFHTKNSASAYVYVPNLPGVELGGSNESHLWKLYIIIFQRWESFKPFSSTLGEDRHMHSGLFCAKFNFKQLLFKAFFDAMRIFGGVEPQTESTSPFLYIIIFQRWESFKSSNSTPGEDIHMHAPTSLYKI